MTREMGKTLAQGKQECGECIVYQRIRYWIYDYTLGTVALQSGELES